MMLLAALDIYYFAQLLGLRTSRSVVALLVFVLIYNMWAGVDYQT